MIIISKAIFFILIFFPTGRQISSPIIFLILVFLRNQPKVYSSITQKPPNWSDHNFHSHGIALQEEIHLQMIRRRKSEGKRKRIEGKRRKESRIGLDLMMVRKEDERKRKIRIMVEEVGKKLTQLCLGWTIIFLQMPVLVLVQSQIGILFSFG